MGNPVFKPEFAMVQLHNGAANIQANAKALGLMKPNARGLDGTIVFGADYLWDFSAGDGITADAAAAN